MTWVLGGIAFGIPAMMVELNLDLNQVVTGLVGWVVLTLGLAVLHSLYKHLTVELLLDPLQLST